MLLDLLVLIGKLLCFLNHFFDLLLREASLVIGDGDLLRLARALIFSADIKNAIGIDLECHLNLRLSTGGWRDTSKLKLTQQMVIFGHRPLTLKNLNVHSWL